MHRGSLLAPAPAPPATAASAVPAADRARPVGRAALAGLAAWIGLEVVARVWGLAVAADERLALGAAPVVGTWRWHPEARLWWAVLAGAALVAAGPAAARRLPWPAVATGSGAVAVAWAVLLAGAGDLARPLEAKRYEYLAVVPKVADPGWFLAHFTDLLPVFPTHVKSHPPGLVLALTGLDRLGLGGSGWAAALVLAGGGLAVAATLVAAREVAGEAAARSAAPFLALAPAAVWVATSADALFAGVTAAGIALVVVATGRRDRAGDALAAAGGAVLAGALLLSYGAAPLLAVPVVVAGARRRARPLVLAGAAGVVVLGAVAAAGFWWLDGLAATRELYEAGVAARRPAAYFALAGNPAALALAAGPAAAAGLAALRDRRAWLLVGAAAAAVLAADLSGLSKGEVERIWLPFVPWLVLATAALAAGRRAWLALQVAAGIVLQAWLVTPW